MLLSSAIVDFIYSMMIKAVDIHIYVPPIRSPCRVSDTQVTIKAQNLVCLCQRAKTSCQTQIHGENILLILRSKVKQTS